jgi:nuclease HARBI1
MGRYHFPGIIGLIDGTHIPLFGLKRQVVGAYINRKGFASKNCQIVSATITIIVITKYNWLCEFFQVVDYDLRITNINARYPGSSHDSFVFQNSRLYARLLRDHTAGEPLFWLLGNY